MVGVVLAAHGRLAEELLLATEQICGRCDGFRAMALSATTLIEDARDAFAAVIQESDEGDGVLVLTDMLGGSPSNIALTFLDERVEIVSGVNLPMLLKVATARRAGMSLPALAAAVASDGQKSIGRARDFLKAAARMRASSRA